MFADNMNGYTHSHDAVANDMANGGTTFFLCGPLTSAPTNFVLMLCHLRSRNSLTRVPILIIKNCLITLATDSIEAL